MVKQKLYFQGMFKLVFYLTAITLFLSLSIRLCYSDMPSVFTTIDPLLNDLTAKAPAFEVDLKFEYGSNPVPSFIYLGTGNQPTLDALLEANLDLFVQKKVPWVDFTAIEGGGLLWFNSPTLTALTHTDFNYDSQYDQDGNLMVDDAKAKKRYVVAMEAVPLIIQKAHAKGLKVSINVESLAHIINRAAGSGIGGDTEETLSVAEDLPAPTLAQFGTFVDEVIALGPDAVSAEAYSTDFDNLLASKLNQAGIPYWHTGTGLGDVWVGYYYSPYPTVPGDLLTYKYLHTHDGQLAMTNSDIYARARAQATALQTSLVVGAYNPLPCDLSLNEYDLYSENRPADQYWIDNETPVKADGTSVTNCAVEFWRNLVLFGTLAQDPDLILISADVKPSIEAALDLDLAGTITARLAEHPYRPPALPVANIIVDVPNFTEKDGYTNDDYLEILSIDLLPLVSDGLEAAGLKTVLTEDTPWTGGSVALTYIITPGGNETNGEDGDMGAPYWNAAQDLPESLANLLDTSVHPGPVFIHPVLGIPSTTNWKSVRTRFGMPDAFQFKNTTLAEVGAQTSLVSSLLVDSTLENITDQKNRLIKASITPDTGEVMGFTVTLPPFLDDTLGQTGHIIGSTEVDPDRIIAQGPILVNHHDDSGNVTSSDQHTVPYLVGDSSKRYLWTINQLHHEAYTYILSKTAAEALGMTAPLAEPASVQMRGGIQTVALAYDAVANFKFNLPVSDGDPVSIRIYDYKGALSSSETVNYSGTLTRSLGKRSLLVAEPINLSIKEGWNLLSLWLGPANTDVETVLGDIKGTIISVWKWMETSWAVYLPDKGDKGAAYAASKGLSQLSDIQSGEGFWINSSTAQSLAFSGEQPTNTSFSLHAGWNLIGLKSSTAKSITDLIAGKETKIASVWKWEGTSWAVALPDKTDGGAAYATGKGFNLLSTINPGEGFWVNCTATVTLE